ncbi:NAD-dependent epimerase/dehydratase family protein [Streptomyces krungchingensis]|uniref:NAD-dependent epimerase/dehydratase family protein n=1 Tax=Streptomyces krungchingensis TaxID=1565034 RepID=UPI003CEA7305
MRILLIGATGYLGSVVAEHLTDTGHEVVALTRTPENPGRYTARHGDLRDPDSLTAAVTRDIDAVINAATPTGDAAVDAAAIDALTAPLRGTDRPFVYTSGVWVLGATGEATAEESSPTNPIPIVGYRPEIERRVLAAADHGVRATVLRPGIIHGRGGGIPALMVDWARKQGAPRVVADPNVRWPMVHIDDLADLFGKVVADAPAGSIWHGVGQPAVPVRELALAAAEAAGVHGEVQVWPLDQARGELGEPFADALALDQSVDGRKAQDHLGWRPQQPDAATDLSKGSYR